MKRLGLAVLIPLLLVFLMVSPALAALSPIEREAAQKAIEECINSLEAKDIQNVQRIAVLKLDNDESDGDITDLLTIALTNTKYSVVLHWEELEKVAVEHSIVIQRADLMDSATIKKLGGFVGADGLVIGSIHERTDDGYEAHLRLNLKLANVETGVAVWGDVAIGAAGEPKPAPEPEPVPETLVDKLLKPASLVLIICALLFVIWLVTVARKPVSDALENRYSVKKDRLDTDRRIRNQMVRELGTAIDTLRNTRNAAYDAKKEELCQRLKDCEHSVDLLRMEISNAEYGALAFFREDKIETKHLDKMIDFDKTFETLLKDIQQGSSEVEKASSENDQEAEKAISKLNQQTKKLKDKFQERKSYLSGIG